jgi:hypothetical protein
MEKSTPDSRGFTLIAALLLTILLSAAAVGLLFLVTNEARMGGNDLEGNLAYYAAEAGIENLTAQLSQLYQTSQTPVAANINALTNPANYPTTIPGSNLTNLTYNENISWPLSDAQGNPKGNWNVIGSGPDQGLVATIIPFDLQVTATRQTSAGQSGVNSTAAATGAAVNMTRTVEVALIPAFEFGVFCDGDCDYFAGPNFNFGGRVHTNGNLFLASGSKLTFTDKVAAVGQVVLDQLENGHATAAGYTGSVYVPNATGGCPAAPGAGPAANCLLLPAGSWIGGFPPTGAKNGAWSFISKSTFNGFIVNGLTGATKLQLPFVQAGVGPIEIVRRPQAADTPLMSNSRLYNKAEIRILLADTQLGLHPERGAINDGQDIQFGVSAVNGTIQPVQIGASKFMYYANADATQDGNWVKPTGYTNTTWPLLGEVTNGFSATTLPSAWIRVEYLNNAGNWVGVTQQWLSYGFGRDTTPPTAPAGSPGANPISPAILILQTLKTPLAQPTAAVDIAAGNTTSKFNWYPINFYDSREGEPRDNGARGGTACSPIGVMNAVELDVGNLNLWLTGQGPYAGGNGPSVNSIKDNGYILYFSDQRGMMPDPDPPYGGALAGSSLLEDVVNAGSPIGTPDGSLEAKTYYKFSPEDVDGSGTLNTQGATNLGVGFGVPAANVTQTYYINGATAGIDCPTTGWANMVTGPRHVLRLVDGGMDNTATSYLPHPIPPATTGNGFTVASEEPVYVWGDYNTSAVDPFWASNGVNNTTPHSAAAIIADAVTLLSPAWTDGNSLTNPGDRNPRNAANSYYRVAIAAGKSIPFPQPVWASQDFGTDGGMHNFLRYLENRGGTSANYVGSMISMYYSQYATGTFKCCSVVYSPPTRNYFFDTLFLNPANLPPGTPMFQDVVSLSYHQNFTPQ